MQKLKCWVVSSTKSLKEKENVFWVFVIRVFSFTTQMTPVALVSFRGSRSNVIHQTMAPSLHGPLLVLMCPTLVAFLAGQDGHDWSAATN